MWLSVCPCTVMWRSVIVFLLFSSWLTTSGDSSHRSRRPPLQSPKSGITTWIGGSSRTRFPSTSFGTYKTVALGGDKCSPWKYTSKCFNSKDATRFLKKSVNPKTGDKTFTCMPAENVYANASWRIEWILGNGTTWLTPAIRFVSTDRSPPTFNGTLSVAYSSRLVYTDENNNTNSNKTGLRVDKSGLHISSAVRADLVKDVHDVKCILSVCLWTDRISVYNTSDGYIETHVEVDSTAVANLSIIATLDDFVYPLGYPMEYTKKSAYSWPSETSQPQMSMSVFFGILSVYIVLIIGEVYICLKCHYNHKHKSAADVAVEYRGTESDPSVVVSSDLESIEILD
ncbi:m05 [Muromegalovirus G4]|uniref:M05 n=2 Tax=Murid herpesvirus 1 TaxID=10366 RepID=B3UWV8_MUHV1|nr:m05 protein [Murid betaherpesvirus 1]ACE95189.1 m05 [Muromegalovirus G4]QNL29144.1 m05 [Muromegalovirus G4]